MINRRNFFQSLPLLGAAAAAPAGAAPVPRRRVSRANDRVYLKPAALSEWNGQLGFALHPPVPEWRLEGTQSAERSSYSGGGYRLDLTFTRPESKLLLLEFRLEREDGQKFQVQGYSVKVQFSMLGIYRLWDYRGGPTELMNQFNSYMRGLSSGSDSAQQTYGANSGFPLMLCANREGRNRFTMGMLDQVEATTLHIGDYSLGLSPRGEGLNFSFEFTKPSGYAITRSRLADGARFDARPGDWFDTIGDYTKWVEATSKIPILKPPPVAYEPIWNTWYPFGQNIDEKIIVENAEFCRKSGIVNLCIDAGYNNSLTAGMSNPADIEAFNNHTGDWVPDRKKFPDFRGMVDHLHNQGQTVTVWVALFIVGKNTRAYPRTRHMLMRNAAGKEQDHLCPCHPETAPYLAQTFLALAKDHDLDGFWLDFMDGLHVPCQAPHPHFTSSTGEGYNRCLAAVRDAVLRWKKEFLIETRMKMSNINVKQFANVLQTTDMPFDFDLNRSLGVVVRSFSEGSAAKLDPAQWHIRESAENVAKSCATVTLSGVPVFGVDFRLLPESHIRVVTAWMQYYRRHQPELSKGKFQPTGFAGLFPQFCVRSGTKAFIYSGSSSVAPVGVSGCNEIHVVNASDTERVALVMDGAAPGRWRGLVRNCFLEQTAARDIEIASGRFLLDLQIPEGGMLELRPV